MRKLYFRVKMRISLIDKGNKYGEICLGDKFLCVEKWEMARFHSTYSDSVRSTGISSTMDLWTITLTLLWSVSALFLCFICASVPQLQLSAWMPLPFFSQIHRLLKCITSPLQHFWLWSGWRLVPDWNIQRPRAMRPDSVTKNTSVL